MRAKLAFFVAGIFVGFVAAYFVLRSGPPEAAKSVQRSPVTPSVRAASAPDEQPQHDLPPTMVAPPQTYPAAQPAAPHAAASTPSESPSELKAKLRQLKSIEKIDRRYGPFLKHVADLGADPKKMRELLIERDLEGNEILDTALEQGLDMRNQVEAKKVNELITQTRRGVTLEMIKTLGQPVMDSMFQYEFRLPERNVLADLNTRLASGPDALSEAQVEQAIEIFYNTKNADGRRVNQVPAAGEIVRIIPDQALTALAAVLTVPQLQKLAEIQTEQKLSSPAGSMGPGIPRPPPHP